MADMKEIPGLVGCVAKADGTIWKRRADTGVVKQVAMRLKKGMWAVQINQDGKNLHRLVAKLVLTAFYGEAPDGCKPIYRDNNKQNCTLANLSWGQRQRKPKGAIDAEMAYDLEYLGERGINKCLQLYWVGGVDKIAIANDLEIEFRTVQHILDTNDRVYGDRIYV